MLRHFFEIIPFYFIIIALNILPFESRVYWGGQVCSLILPLVRNFYERVDKNLKLIYPNWSHQKRKEFIKENSKMIGKSFVGPECGHEFPEPKKQYMTCDSCGALNPISNDKCDSCGTSFKTEFTIELRDAYRDGIITRGMELTNDEAIAGEKLDPSLDKDILSSGQETLIALWSQIPPSAKAKFINLVNQPRD
jgi:transcription elongation factor Elf1